MRFDRGDRVRLNKEAADRNAVFRRTDLNRCGTVTGSGLYAWVLWDGLKTPQQIHPDFLEVVPCAT